VLEKTLGKVTGRAAKDIAEQESKQALKALTKADYFKTAGDYLSTGRFLLQSSNFEAGMEARHNFHDAVDTFMSDFEDKNGRAPSMQELSDFTTKASSAANWVYGTNMAILGVSNAAMFGNLIDVRMLPKLRGNVDNFFNKAIGLGVKSAEDGTRVLQKANRAQKIAGTTFKILEKPMIEGLYEEGLQGVAGKTMQNYLESTYNPENSEALSVFSSFAEAMEEQYGTSEGWKEMTIGMLIGSVGGLPTGGGVPGFGKNSYGARRKQLEKEVGIVNSGMEGLQTTLQEQASEVSGVTLFRAMTKASSAKKSRMSVEEDSFTPSYENAKLHKDFIDSQMHLKDSKEILADYSTVVEKLTFSPEQASAIESQGMTVEQYKAGMLQEFQENLDSYQQAKKAVTNLGLDRVVELSPGNQVNLADAAMWNIMVGLKAQKSAKNIAREIESVTGLNGVADVVDFYNNLTTEAKAKVSELKSKQRRVKELRSRSLDIQNQLVGIQAKRQANVKDETLKRRYATTAEKFAIANREVAQLQEEIDNLGKALADEDKVNKIKTGRSVNGTAPTGLLSSLEEVSEMSQGVPLMGIPSAIEQIEALDTYIESLDRVGKKIEANTLRSLQTEYKLYSDAHREFTNGLQRMAETNFFQTKKGRGLLQTILGGKYEMSSEFKQTLKDNDAILDSAFQKVGLRTMGGGVEQIVQQAIQDNPNLSDREKFQLEAMIRLQLSMLSTNTVLENISALNDIAEVDATTGDTNSLEGDTVTLARKLSVEANDLNSVEILDKTIKQVTDQIDQLRKTVQDPSRIAELEANLEAAKERLEQIQNQPTTTSAPETVLAQLEANLAEQRASEFSTPESIAELEQQVQDLKTQIEGSTKATQEEVQTEGQEAGSRYDGITSIEEIEGIISQLEEELSNEKGGIRIVDSEDYVRFNELAVKEGTEGLNEQEQAEFDQLKDDLDQWLYVSGVVVEGIRLSDLIRQKVTLQTTQPTALENVAEVLAVDLALENEMRGPSRNANYDSGQTYEAVYVSYRADVGGIELSGIREEDIPTVLSETEDDGNITPLEINYEYDTETGNFTILPKDGETIEETLDRINTPKSNISIFPTHTDTGRNYGAVIAHTIGLDGDVSSKVASTDLTNDYTVPQRAEAIYNLQVPTEEAAGEELTLKVDTRDPYNQTLLSRLRTAKGKKAINEAKEVLRKNLRITIFDSKGNFIATLKGKNSEARKRSEDIKFEQFRDSIIADQRLLDQLLTLRELRAIPHKSIKVKQVLVGQSNHLYKKNPDGSVSFLYKPFNTEMSKKVVDIGYATGGKLQTRSGLLGINTTFLASKMKANPDAKIPFVVFEVGTMRIAYPVQVVRQDKQDNSSFSQIFNSTLDPSTKAIRLNQFLAERGVNINTPGNFFYSVGENNNLTSEFFNNKLAQLDQIEYFYPLDSWIKSSIPMTEILTQQALINVDVTKPFHSPKVVLNMTEVLADFTTQTTTSSEQVVKKSNDSKKGTTKLSSVGSRLKNLPSAEDVLKNAQDNIQKDC
jgi:hypothetical protein